MSKNSIERPAVNSTLKISSTRMITANCLIVKICPGEYFSVITIHGIGTGRQMPNCLKRLVSHKTLSLLLIKPFRGHACRPKSAAAVTPSEVIEHRMICGDVHFEDNSQEWKILALILDRMFFVLNVVTIAICAIAINVAVK